MGGKKKVLLIDGHSLAYRAFFALPDSLSTADGKPTNAVYGFAGMLFRVLGREKPQSVVVAFDGPRVSLERTKEFPEYKAQRPTMPDELRVQMGLIERLLESMRIPTVMVEGYEADDLLGAMASRISESGGDAVILTGDRDMLQLVGEGTRVLLTGRGVSETQEFDEKSVMERYGVEPERIPDVVGLKGDSSDNIPGVPGIGEKGAVALIKEFGSLEALYERLDQVRGQKRKEALEDNKETAFLSKRLAVIDTDAPVDERLIGSEFGDWDVDEVLSVLEELEFKTLASRFLEMFGGSERARRESPGEGEIIYSVVDPGDREGVGGFSERVRCSGSVAVAALVEGTNYCDYVVRELALASSDAVMPVCLDGDGGPALDAAGEILSSEVEKIFHSPKSALEALGKSGIAVRNVVFDTELAAYLENPSLGGYRIWELWEKNSSRSINLGVRGAARDEQARLPGEGREEDVGELVADAARVYHLRRLLEKKLADLGMLELYERIEMPLVDVLREMEETGVAIDADLIRDLSREAEAVMRSLEQEIFDFAGREFNIGSTKQLAAVLFEEMGLPPAKKTKTGYSTDSSVLEYLSLEHPIASRILDYREYAKLKSTYLGVLPTLICPQTGRVHCTFNQTATATGRISSSNPNLQNIPVRTEIGRKIRSAFVAGEEGWKILVADYSQIELRVLAHMSEDPLLLGAFSADADVHRETAAQLFGVDSEHVTPEMRRMAKTVNFGIVYGMGQFGLASRLGITREEATDFIERYFQKYAGVSDFRRRCCEEASRKGYAETLLGRRRFIPELSSGNRQKRELGERLAINTPLQGTAADIIKKAMVDIAAAIRAEGLKSRMTLQIHDELLFEVEPGEVETMRLLVGELMSGALELRVPLKVDIGVHENWGEAK